MGCRIGVFDRRVHATGDRVSGAATHNLLLDVGWLRRLDMRFDERLGLTGGEDTMFSHQLIDRGATIRWCDEALVLDRCRQIDSRSGGCSDAPIERGRRGVTWNSPCPALERHG